MSFDLQKYLIENSLTLTGKKRLSEDVDPDETPEPTKADMKQTDKEMRDLQKNKKELATKYIRMYNEKHPVYFPKG